MGKTDSSNTPSNGPLKDPVLLVDDERPLLDMYVAALSPVFEITTATSAAEAMEQLKRKPFKVIVADHVMPKESGIDLLTRTRQEHPHTQRILATGYMKPEMLLRSVNDAAVFRTLTKPVPVAEFVKVLREAAAAHDASLAGQ